MTDALFPLSAEMLASAELVSAARQGDAQGVKAHLDLAGHQARQDAFLRAAENGHTAIVRLLVHRVDLDHKRTALMAAATEGHREVAEAVLEGQRRQVLAGGLGRDAFQLAEACGRVSMVDLLAPAVSPGTLTVALQRAAQRTNLEMVEAIIPHCDTEAINDALMWCAGDGMLEVASALLPHAHPEVLERVKAWATRNMHYDIAMLVGVACERQALLAAVQAQTLETRQSRRM